MLVIEHNITGERFMFPQHNVNKETYEGFIQFQVIPEGFSLSADQTPVPVTYINDNTNTQLVRWEANSKDPVNTMDKWRK